MISVKPRKSMNCITQSESFTSKAANIQCIRLSFTVMSNKENIVRSYGVRIFKAGKNVSTDDILKYVFLFFSQNAGFDSSGKSSPSESNMRAHGVYTTSHERVYISCVR